MNTTVNMLRQPPGIPEWQWILAQVQSLLIEGGFKQATTIHIEDTLQDITDSLSELSNNLLIMGFYSRADLKSNSINIGVDENALDQLELCLSGNLPVDVASRIHGELSGFPDSAVEAFIANEIIEPEVLTKAIRLSPEYVFAMFRLSKTNWQEELETGKKWAIYIKNNAPDLYESYLKEFTDKL